MARKWLLTVLGVAVVLAANGATFSRPSEASQAAPPPAAQQTKPKKLAPYVPTPHDVVERMLALAEVTSKDFVIDLGCGDGRIPIAAAKKYGARGLGVDIDPVRIEEAEAAAKKHGVSHLVSFQLQDAMQVDVSQATVVTLYLLSSSNMALRPRLTQQLRPGSRVVSHAFRMGDWEPEREEMFMDAGGEQRVIYLWRADGKVRP
jgi:SAM-dependent methyltransferase